MTVRSRLAETAHPRLALLVLGGVVSFLLAGAAALAGPAIPGAGGALAFRLSVIGYLLVLFGVAGYVAIGVSERVLESGR